MSDPARPLDVFRASNIVDVIVAFRDALIANQEALNRLNVYPVPDGDTGTNMALTMTSVVAELELAANKAGVANSYELSMSALCAAISHGALMGARGNSGVILSQILRGVATRFRETEQVGPHEFALALAEASAAAYSAVMKPIEGTILTVARSAAEGAADALHLGSTLLDVVVGARNQAAIGLAQTPDLLPVLKAAGVVDSGGSGYLLLIDAALRVIDGRPVPLLDLEAGSLGKSTAQPTGRRSSDTNAVTEKDVSELRYEVMYHLEALDSRIDSFKKRVGCDR